MQLKLKSYKQLVQMGKEALDAVLATAKAKSQNKKAELKLAELEEQCATLESKITESCSSKELNFDQIIDKLDELALVERKRTQMEDLLAQLFPKEEAK